MRTMLAGTWVCHRSTLGSLLGPRMERLRLYLQAGAVQFDVRTHVQNLTRHVTFEHVWLGGWVVANLLIFYL